MVTTDNCAPAAPLGVGMAAVDAQAGPALPGRTSALPGADAPAGSPDTPSPRTTTRGIGFAKFEKVLVTSLDVSDDDSNDSDRLSDGDSDSDNSAGVKSGDETARVAASVADENKHLGNTAVARCVSVTVTIHEQAR
jgi:hypothetical protein